MKTLYIKSARKVRQHKKELEQKLKVKITVKGTDTTISGNEVDEYFAERVLLSVDYPFLIEDSLLLAGVDFMFEVLHIRDYTRRHDMDVIKGRIIGKKGKTLQVLQNLSESVMAVKDNSVAIIAPVEEMETARQAVISIIQGSKQGNVYGYLEKHKGRKRRG